MIRCAERYAGELDEAEGLINPTSTVANESNVQR